MNTRKNGPRVRERGVALIVVLILLLIVTLLGLASLRGTLLEERMSANLYDRSLAFQAAESALREAELQLSAVNAVSSFPASGCTAWRCAPPVKPSSGTWYQRWDSNSSFNGWQDATAVASGDTTITPQYFAEYVGLAPGWTGCDQQKPPLAQCLKPRFRITARTNTNGRARVMLQTSYASP